MTQCRMTLRGKGGYVTMTHEYALQGVIHGIGRTQAVSFYNILQVMLYIWLYTK